MIFVKVCHIEFKRNC